MNAVPWGGGETGQPALIPATLRGYRLMTVVSLERTPAFLSLRGGWTAWNQPHMQAECLRGGDGTQPISPSMSHAMAKADCTDSPGDGCFCGIYNSYDPWTKLTEHWPSYHWIAVTANWDKIILGPYGFRSANARILAVAPREGSLDRWTQYQSLPNTAPWRKQRNFMASFGVDVQPHLAALMQIYPPDDVSNIRPEPAAA